MVKKIISLLGLLSLIGNGVIAEEIRDYYAEPGLNPFKATLDDIHESIDPFSGTLQLKYTDIVIPGNGGLDIRINRTYTSPQDSSAPGIASAYGVGWTIHFGRIITSIYHEDKLCNQGSLFSVSTKDNPSLELPDGGREILVARDAATFPELDINDLITRSNWKATCAANNNGLIVTSPSGLIYTMDQYEKIVNGTNDEPSWFTSRIEDVHGNWIAISYIDGGVSSGYKLIDEITTSDGRYVKFDYQYPANDAAHLDKITANNQVWDYNYVSVDGLGAYQLVEVIRPDNQKWQYAYYPSTSLKGKYALQNMTYPQGGTVSYTYEHVIFDPDVDLFPTTVVSSKNTSGVGVSPGTWSYNYSPGGYTITDSETGQTQNLDLTTIITPKAQKKYYHYGVQSDVKVWNIGLLGKEQTYDVTGASLLDDITYYWGARKLSDENYWHGRTKLDVGTFSPVLAKKFHWRDGANYETTYNSYDRFGNAAQIVEVGNIDVRTTNYTYHVDPSNWIVNSVEDETLIGVGTIDRTYNPNGTLKSESKYGVVTDYTYHATGDLATVTDARGKALGYSTSYNDYYRGVAREEVHPVNPTKNILKRRAVNPTGTVASVTNGRGLTTSFTYDLLNRVKTIDYPKMDSDDVAINYLPNAKVLTRGNYQERVEYDGFGQVVQTNRADTISSETITVDQKYDAIGNLVFKSYPNDINGTNFTYDALGRVTLVEHPDGTSRQFEYLVGQQQRVTNERGFSTLSRYSAYGDPDDRTLFTVESPDNILTVTERNRLGQITRVWQGAKDIDTGLERIYSYDSRFFLTSVLHPETGLTEFGRDEIGNLTSKTIAGNLLSQFSYDYQNRITLRDYGDPALIDVTLSYDDNNNIIDLVRGSADTIISKSFSYDDNDNLLNEALNYHGHQYSISYNYTSLDFTNSITYPTGRVVTYTPDALGRPTRAAPYVTSVNYYPSGQMQDMTYANGQVTHYTLNNRQWVESISASGNSAAIDLFYTYDGAGNVESISDSLNTQNNLSLGYDGVDRLVVADGVWGQGNVVYDEMGNIKSKTLGDKTLTYYYTSNRLSHVEGNYYPYEGAFFTFNKGYDYDFQGNAETISGYDSFIHWYDNAGNMELSYEETGYDDPYYYYYDGNDRRVIKSEKKTQLYVYAQNDNLLSEYDAQHGWLKEYVYLGSQMIADIANVPESPTSLTIPAFDDDGEYTITWNAGVGNITRYEVYESTHSDFSTQKLVYIGAAYSTLVTGNADGMYYYRVRACNSYVCSDYYEAPTATAVLHIPGVPLGIYVPTADVPDGNYSVTWSGATGTVDTYELYESTLADFSDTTLITSTTALEHAFTAKSGGTYYYQVRACNASGCSGFTNSTAVVVTTATIDTVAPIVTAPADISVEATGVTTSVNLGTATANDDVDGVLTPVADNTGPFTVGQHTVTWSATDAAGNTGTAIQLVMVTDTTAPTVTAPAAITLEATGPLTTVDLGVASANDIVDGALVPVPSLQSPFTVGTHIVIWTATDSAGNMGSAAQLVTITMTDTTPPTITAPPAITFEATGPLTTVDLGIASANDLVDGALVASPDQTGPFAVGQHIVTWSATDAAGNTGSASQLVIITDTTPPTVTPPADITVTASFNRFVTFSQAFLTNVDLGVASAYDLVDGSLVPTANNYGPFDIGTHTVTWSVTDANGNVGSATQSVTVVAPWWYYFIRFLR